MTSESTNRDRRSAQLAAVIGTVLACYANGAAAIEFEFENGGKLNWNTTVSVGASWRAEDPSRQLYTRADGSLIGLYSAPLTPGTAVGFNDGLAGNHAAGDGNLNYAKGDRFSTPFKVITDVEYKKGRYGALLRAKYWYDQALNQENVLIGSQANNFNGVRPRLGPIPGYGVCTPSTPPGTACLPVSPVGQNLWPKGKLSDRGFEAEQQFENVLLLDAYVYGSFDVGDSDLQLRVGNQVINWGESIFIQGVNQINPIDVPAARRAGAELKEILLPVWAVYANWGFNFGSLEAFYQLQWNNTSVDGCGTYFTATSTLISANPGACNSITVVGGHLGNLVPGTSAPTVPQLGSQPWQQAATGTYVPAIQGREASDSGQFGLAFRFPIEKIDTEIGLYAMNIHSRLPVAASYTGTNWKDLTQAQKDVLTAAGRIGTDTYGNYWTTPGSTTRLRSLMPGPEAYFEGLLAANGVPADLESGKGFWEYPEDIQIYGISAATNLLSWSTSAELSYQVDVPVMANGNDLIGAGVLGIGPYRERARAVQAESAGAYLIGHDLFNKTQFQVNAVKSFSNILGAENMLVVGEIGSQWNDVPDYTKGGIRYGRGFMFGTGSGPGYAADPSSPEGQPGLGAFSQGNLCSPTFVGAPVPIANTLYNPQPNGCYNDGYVTDVAWGYRLRVSADYNNVMDSGVTVTPSVFWAHDVEGVSMDPTFIEDRMTLGVGVKFNYNKKYLLDINYVNYDNDNFDPLFDRDYYSAAVSVTF
jgi:hypothetical protein